MYDIYLYNAMYILSLVKRLQQFRKTRHKVELLGRRFTFVAVFIPQSKPCSQQYAAIGGFVRAFSVCMFQLSAKNTTNKYTNKLNKISNRPAIAILQAYIYIPFLLLLVHQNLPIDQYQLQIISVPIYFRKTVCYCFSDR